MHAFLRVFAPSVIVLLLTGCGANFNAIHYRNESATVTPTTSVDAKQRFLTSNQRASSDKASKEKIQVLCAEPSPDTLSVLSSAMTGTFGLDRAFGGSKDLSASLSAALSRAESGASIGLRTQTIQLLRDGMYRLCEAYASEALDNKGFKQLQQRYQTVMLALLSIEQLTGTVSARAVSLGGTSTAETADSLATLQEKYAEAIKEKATADEALSRKKAELATAKQAEDAALKSVNTCASACANKSDLDAALATAKTKSAAAETAATSAQTDANIAQSTVDFFAKAVTVKGNLLKTGASAQSLISTDSPSAVNQAIMTSDVAESIATRVRQIAFGAMLSTHAFDRCFDTDDWLRATKDKEVMEQMKLMCNYAVAALVTGSANDNATTYETGASPSKSAAVAKPHAGQAPEKSMPTSEPIASSQPQSKSKNTPSSDATIRRERGTRLDIQGLIPVK
jgi:hypothetical protein